MWFALFQLSKQFFRRGDYLRFFTSVSSADLLFNLQKLDAFFSVSKVLLVLLLLLFHSHTSIPHFDYSALNPVVLSLSFAASIVYEWFVLPFYISLEDSVSMIGENDYATVSCICRASDHPDQGSRDFFFLFQGKFLHIIGSSAAHRSRHWSMLQKLLLSGTRSLLCWLFFSDRPHRHREDSGAEQHGEEEQEQQESERGPRLKIGYQESNIFFGSLLLLLLVSGF